MRFASMAVHTKAPSVSGGRRRTKTARIRMSKRVGDGKRLKKESRSCTTRLSLSWRCATLPGYTAIPSIACS